MNFSVGTNWEPDVPAATAGTEVTDFFASPARTVLGTGRPAENLPDVSRIRIAEHVREIHDIGATFTYLMNSPWSDALEFDTVTRRALMEELDWVRSIGADYVVLAIPYLFELVKRNFPELRIKASYSNRVTTVEHAVKLANAGAEMVCLHQSMMREFPFLRAVRRALPDTRLQLIVDVSCIPHCPSSYAFHHASACPALSRNDSRETAGGYHSITHGMAWCHSARLNNPSYLLAGGFIRPEDVGRYEDVGIDSLKLATRPLATPAILRKVKAYLDRRYDGNLLDIINIVSFGLPDKMYGKATDTSGAAKAYADIKNRFDFSKMVVIDNRALDGFLDHFIKRPCPSSCLGCNVCDTYASKAVTMRPEMVEEFSGLLDEYRAGLCSGCGGN